MRLYAFIIIVLVAMTSARPARACSCVATTLEHTARTSEFVALVEVGAARAEANGVESSPIVLLDVLRGPAPSATTKELRVRWVKPDGASCQMTDLRPGKWLVFLSWSPPDGTLWVNRCDAHSRPMKTVPKQLITHFGAITTEKDAIEVAGRTVRRMLAAQLFDNEFVKPIKPDLDLARVEVARVAPHPDGGYVVTWSQHPPAGYSVDASVRVFKDGRAHVTRADASFSPD